MTSFEEARAEAETWLALEGVVGVGEGQTEAGARSVVVMVTSKAVAPLDRIPESLHGTPVEIVELGVISAEDGEDPIWSM